MTKPLVSILIPVYNREELVRRAIESAINQSYGNIEVIAVDNQSMDRTYEVLKEYAEKYPNVKVYQNEENLGPVRNWKKCLEYSSGKFIKILFSDDWIEETFIEKCMKILSAHEDVGFVFTKTLITDGNKEYSYINDVTGKKESDFFLTESIKVPYGMTPVSPGCALFRRKDVIIENNIPNSLSLSHENTGAGIDLLIYLNSLKRYKYCYYTSDTTAYFRKHKGSITITEWGEIWKYYFTALLYYVKREGMADLIYDLKLNICKSFPLKDFIRYERLLQLYGFEDSSINKQDFILLGIKKCLNTFAKVSHVAAILNNIKDRQI